MPSDDTLVDRWLRWIKNQKLLATFIVLGIVIGALASFTDSLSRLFKFWRDSREQSAVAKFFELKPDYSKHDRLWYPSLLYPELRSKVESLRKLASEEGINLQYFETYRPPAVQHEMFVDPSRPTPADAWSSPKQYGLAATLWIYESSGWASNPPAQLANKLALLATTVGLQQEGKTGLYVPWTYMLPSTKVSDLKAGHYPPRTKDDERWADNINAQIKSWGERSPPAPPPVPPRQ